MIITGETVASLLRASRLAASTEAVLQQRIEAVLSGTDPALPFEREARLAPGERIDFLVDGRIGVEAKTKYAKRAIFRQLERYAAIERIEALILVTGTAMGLPPALGPADKRKPIYYVSIGRGAL